MSHTLKHRQDKIQAKRKTTPWRQFVMEIASRQPNVFYKVNNLISRFPETDRIPGVIEYNSYHEQQSKQYTEGVEYNNRKDFFENFSDLRHGVQATNMINFFMSENCDYGDVVSKGKNIYLSTFVVNGDQDVMYCFGVKDECIRILNSSMISDHSENIYHSLGISNSFKVLYSRFITNCSDVYFCINLQGCKHCLLCDSIENKSYCYRNEQYSKDEYNKVLKELLNKKDQFESLYETISQIPGKDVASKETTGLFAVESKNLENAYFTYRITKGRNIINVGGFEGNTNIYDVVDGGGPALEDIYGVNGIAINSTHCYVSCHVPNCHNIYYSYYLESCSFCLGCIGLKGKSYCILNKQYTKDEWHQKVDKIFFLMEEEGTVGNFFPGSMNPFYFNDTVASLIEDFSKEEVEAAGYLRRDNEVKVDIPDWMNVVDVKDLGDYEGFNEDGKRTINPVILKKVIKDDSGNSYRIIKMEYDFLVKHGLPLPRKHRLERLKSHFKITK